MFNEKAQLHSATCFLNSFLREWKNWNVHDNQSVIITLKEKYLSLPLKKYSKVGKFQYTGQFFLLGANELEQIDFIKLVQIISSELSLDFDKRNNFQKRVFSSQHNMASYIKNYQDRSGENLNFIAAEKSLVLGHSFHPTPKSREPFSEVDQIKYSPELNGSFQIVWLLAHSTIVHQNNARTFEQPEWSRELFAMESADKKEFVPFPMHPWQYEHLRSYPVIQKYINQGLLIYKGSSDKSWHSTSSLRTIYREDAPYMLKFSISVKMTNSIRHLLVKEVERGLQLHDVLNTQVGKKFLSENNKFQVITEPAYFCLKNEDGQAMAETLVVCRNNIFTQDNCENKYVLAYLTQDGIHQKNNAIVSMIEKYSVNQNYHQQSLLWFMGYLQTVVKPLISAQSDHGIILGAHQQNLILAIEQGLPTIGYFRDCQSTGYSELGFKLFASDVKLIDRDNGNVVPDLMGNILLAYYLIINSTFGVIAAIAQSGWIEEKELLVVLKDLLIQLREQKPKDTSFLDYLLDSEYLMYKGNFLCTLENINENTTQNPLAIYSKIPNPIRGDEHEQSASIASI